MICLVVLLKDILFAPVGIALAMLSLVLSVFFKSPLKVIIGALNLVATLLIRIPVIVFADLVLCYKGQYPVFLHILNVGRERGLQRHASSKLGVALKRDFDE